MQLSILKTPDKAEVIAQLRRCEIAHLACHGQSNCSDPSKSCFLFADWEIKGGLSVADITSLKRKHSQLIYMSTCYAATNQVESLLEEGIHMSAGFQLSGFPRLVGTLWSVSDIHSAGSCNELLQ